MSDAKFPNYLAAEIMLKDDISPNVTIACRHANIATTNFYQWRKRVARVITPMEIIHQDDRVAYVRMSCPCGMSIGDGWKVPTKKGFVLTKIVCTSCNRTLYEETWWDAIKRWLG